VQAAGDDVCLSLVSKDQLQCLLCYLLSEDEFLSSYGIRSLSKVSFNFFVNFHISSLQQSCSPRDRSRSKFCCLSLSLGLGLEALVSAVFETNQ